MANIESLYAQEGLHKLIAVSETDGEIVACIAYRTFAPGVAEMKRLYVKPAHRGRHLGRILAETIINITREGGLDKLILDTMVEMKAPQQLYHQLGSHMIPPHDDQDPERLLCYEKQLQAKFHVKIVAA